MPRDLPVREIMTTDVVTLHSDDSVEDAVRLLTERGISGAPVVDDDGRLLGLLDDSDLLLSEARVHAPTAIEILGAYIPLPGTVQRFEDELRHALAQTAGDLMERGSPSVTPGDTLEDVATAMVEHHVSRVPVVDGERRVVGIVSRGDLVAAMGRDAELGQGE
jgi:CBS domain-containing protein